VLAGPIEAAAAGNLCAQFMAAGELGGLNDARRVVRDSFEIKEFFPENVFAWDEAYGRFLQIVSNAD
jgi:rhamnulokinase